jgi:hypothetical protein
LPFKSVPLPSSAAARTAPAPASVTMAADVVRKMLCIRALHRGLRLATRRAMSAVNFGERLFHAVHHLDQDQPTWRQAPSLLGGRACRTVRRSPMVDGSVATMPLLETSWSRLGCVGIGSGVVGVLKLTVVKAPVASRCHDNEMLPSKPINCSGRNNHHRSSMHGEIIHHGRRG